MPAAIRIAPPKRALVVVIAIDSIAVSCNRHCANAATALNVIQTTKYADAKTAIRVARCAAVPRCMPAKSITTGAADGVIMPIIITDHMTNA